MSDPTPARSPWPFLLVALATVALLAPFLGRPLHIDDPLFVWAGQHIARHPADPYGFDVTWVFTTLPMSRETQNPPLACYYLAVAGTLLGWSEPALHLAFLLPAVALAWGTYRLAALLSTRPLFAVLLTLAAPVVLVSATSLMCDTLMTALWVWAVVFWLQGTRAGRFDLMLAAGLLAALAALTKYYALALVPLFAAHALLARLPVRRWLPSVALVVLALVLLEAAARRLYGHGLVTQAFGFASDVRGSGLAGRLAPPALVTGLAFLGACLGSPLFLAPWLLTRRALTGLAVVAALAAGVACLTWGRLPHVDHPALVTAQVALWAAVGAGLLVLALADVRADRSPDAVLLLLWVLGTFVFAASLNYTNNGRSVLPLTPAVAILVARRLDRRAGPARSPLSLRPAGLALVPAALLALACARADTAQARANRRAAEHFAARAAEHPDGALWFLGHWGWQYYLQQSGGRPWDYARSRAEPGDLLVLPRPGFIIPPSPRGPWPDPPESSFVLRETHAEPACPWLVLHNEHAGSGFYASFWGPLPFSFGPVRPDLYRLYECLRPSDLPFGPGP